MRKEQKEDVQTLLESIKENLVKNSRWFSKSRDQLIKLVDELMNEFDQFQGVGKDRKEISDRFINLLKKHRKLEMILKNIKI